MGPLSAHMDRHWPKIGLLREFIQSKGLRRRAVVRVILASFGGSEYIKPSDMSIFKNSTRGPIPWVHFKPIWTDIGPKLVSCENSFGVGFYSV